VYILCSVAFLEGYLSSVWISIEQSVMVFGIGYVFLGFVVVIGHVQLSLLIMGWGATGAWTTIGRLIIFLVLLKIGREVSTCIRMTPVKSVLNQTIHSIVIRNPNALDWAC